MRVLWVIEMFTDYFGTRYARWEVTTGASLTRKSAREEIKTWKQRCPDDKFRIRKYVPS